MTLPPAPDRGWPRRLESAPHPVAAIAGLVLLAAVGVGFAPRLLPDRHGPAPAPALAIDAALPGLGTETVERALTVPFERAVADLAGLREIEARTRPGHSRLLLGFASAAARDAAIAELPARLAPIARGAGALRAPAVAVENRAAVVAAVYELRARAPKPDAVRWARTSLAEALRALPGVTGVAIAGTRERGILVQPDMERLAALGLGFDDLVSALDPLPASAQALAAASVQLPGGEPVPLSELARVAVVARPGEPPPDSAPARLIVRARRIDAAEVAERVRAHLAWLDANDLVPAQLTLAPVHDEARVLRAWEVRVLGRVALCLALILAFLGMVFGLRRAALAALGVGVWLPATLAVLWLLGLALSLPVVAGVLIAAVPLVLLMVLARAGIVYLAVLVATAALWAAARVAGAAFSETALALAAAVALAGPVRWLLGAWLSPSGARGVVSRLGTATVPLRTAALALAVFALATVLVSLYALPGVQAVESEGNLKLRLVGEDERQLKVAAGGLTARLYAIPRVVNVTATTAQVERWRLKLDPVRLRARQIAPPAIGRAFAIADRGLGVGAIIDDGARLPVRVRLAPGAAGAAFERLLLRGRRGDRAALYLADVGSAERAREPRARLRVNGHPAAELRAHWFGREARAELRRYCRRLEIPKNYEADCRIIAAPEPGGRS